MFTLGKLSETPMKRVASTSIEVRLTATTASKWLSRKKLVENDTRQI